jgi:uncharacterized protein YxeA
MLLSAIIGLIFIIGCSGSEDKHKMSGLLQEYSQTLDEYSDAVNKADTAKKAEIEAKLNAYDSRWSDMKIEMADRITPQALDEFDQEYKKFTKKYKELAKKS